MWVAAFFLLLAHVLLVRFAVNRLVPLLMPSGRRKTLALGWFGGLAGILIATAWQFGPSVAGINPIAAFVTTLGVFVFLWWILDPITRVMGPAGNGIDLIRYLNFSDHFFANLFRGVIDLGDIIFYLSVTALSLFLGTVSVEMGRWR